jgi:hypothetical protein
MRSIVRQRCAAEPGAHRCDAVVLGEIGKAMKQGLAAVPPGRFRLTIEEEWTAFMADKSKWDYRKWT